MKIKIIKLLIFSFLFNNFLYSCCKKNNKNENNINNNDEKYNSEDKNIKIIRNNNVYVSIFENKVTGEIARKLYIFANSYKNKKNEEIFLNSNDEKLKKGYFNTNYLDLNEFFYSNIVYLLFDKKTDDIICLLSIEDRGNKKITINEEEIQPKKTYYISLFTTHYKYRKKGYGKILMLYFLQQFLKNTGFYLTVRSHGKTMTNKKLSEIYKNFGFKISCNDKYDPDKDKDYDPIMAFIKKDDKTYYKNNPIKIIIEEK